MECCFTLDHILEQTSLHLKTVDCYTQNNMIWGGVYLRASFSADILAKVTALVGVQAHGPATHLAFIAAMKMRASFEGLEKTKNELFALSLKDIPGENVPEINLKIMEHVNQLECSWEFHPEHIPKIVSICETCTEEQFLQWICGIHDLANDCAEKLCLYDAEVLGLPAPFFHAEKLIMVTNKKFNTMFDGNRWSPATTVKSAENPLPAGFQAAVEKCVKSAINKSDLQQKSFRGGGNNNSNDESSDRDRSQSKGNDKSKDKCHNCGKLGHHAHECKQSKSSRASDSKEGFVHDCGFVEPAAAWKINKTEEIIARNSDVCRWCTKCRRGKGAYNRDHESADHDTWWINMQAKCQKKKFGALCHSF